MLYWFPNIGPLPTESLDFNLLSVKMVHKVFISFCSTQGSLPLQYPVFERTSGKKIFLLLYCSIYTSPPIRDLERFSTSLQQSFLRLSVPQVAKATVKVNT